ncbi:hypothetical protein [Mycobacterium sp. GA-2829]|uniref:hypothetical protein n=1 Tax=Mycobacterium sp. GA-2829 TaxID=1772283 RepID=UPI00073FE540|nr:hypothetical protein [Mycobacterium sp. GA-2829]KUI34232.1 hypothetical protein AU194_17955 [Mycobacterium sp. GA-2829]
MLTDRDDCPHDVEPEFNFEESMNFEFHDLETGLAGFLRLANRLKEGGQTRIVESTVRWHPADGPQLHGMAEYLDQMLDGQPVGIRV